METQQFRHFIAPIVMEPRRPHLLKQRLVIKYALSSAGSVLVVSSSYWSFRRILLISQWDMIYPDPSMMSVITEFLQLFNKFHFKLVK
ncbi:unnamed protein product [Gongylonema pulchrum]|uniref:Cytochrome c oxidase subunit 7C, mitochondrial n=1 Tax=Gongylonema pulchrum TaxID=637853 RepID=A0A183DP76_9BILA|nr:unnamed protein product [Gongylonema pulchrum]